MFYYVCCFQSPIDTCTHSRKRKKTLVYAVQVCKRGSHQCLPCYTRCYTKTFSLSLPLSPSLPPSLPFPPSLPPTLLSSLSFFLSALGHFTHTPEDLLIPQGSIAFFECSVEDAMPTPTFTWYKGGEPIIPNGMSVYVSNVTHTLLMRDVEDEDSGSYHCHVENIAGSMDSPAATLSLTAQQQFDSTYTMYIHVHTCAYIHVHEYIPGCFCVVHLFLQPALKRQHFYT